MVMTKDKKTIYACTRTDNYQVTKYVVEETRRKWNEISDLPKAYNDETEYMLQLKLDKEDKTLLGTTGNGFVIWFLDIEEINRNEAIVLNLPHGVRNISTRMMCSNSIMISGTKDYAVAGVR